MEHLPPGPLSRSSQPSLRVSLSESESYYSEEEAPLLGPVRPMVDMTPPRAAAHQSEEESRHGPPAEASRSGRPVSVVQTAVAAVRLASPRRQPTVLKAAQSKSGARRLIASPQQPPRPQGVQCRGPCRSWSRSRSRRRSSSRSRSLEPQAWRKRVSLRSQEEAWHSSASASNGLPPLAVAHSGQVRSTTSTDAVARATEKFQKLKEQLQLRKVIATVENKIKEEVQPEPPWKGKAPWRSQSAAAQKLSWKPRPSSAPKTAVDTPALQQAQQHQQCSSVTSNAAVEDEAVPSLLRAVARVMEQMRKRKDQSWRSQARSFAVSPGALVSLPWPGCVA
mmetsp:Transcript_49150/g.158731  ORF Transcript_49150/g.158731 Transcript_49150/m.158731 type:complete len:336 (+) Transcript_49150:142-1149(+)